MTVMLSHGSVPLTQLLVADSQMQTGHQWASVGTDGHRWGIYPASLKTRLVNGYGWAKLIDPEPLTVGARGHCHTWHIHAYQGGC